MISIPSPCVGICRMDESTGLCLGCARTGEEIAIWRETGEAQRRRIWAALPARFERLGLTLARLPWTPSEILAFVAGKLRSREGSWAIGCYGGVAEFRAEAGEDCEIAVDGERVTARTDRGALRLRIGDAVRALALYETPGQQDLRAIFLVVARLRAGLPVASGLSALGADRAAILPQDRGQGLYDLGLRRTITRFCIRTDKAALVETLTPALGQSWPNYLPAVGAAILRESPVRVVESALGRAEVRTPIPPPGAASIPGPHTHLLPDLLAMGREMGPGFELPEAYAPGAIFYPSPPAND
ncbi:DUF1289 domain-containing protein [Hypericibacter sp.]|uniref:DUF1289 domain-containing protein n=1 Tax=Hypericibacter sp. TaxID=2705401 RepID=UPI003D6CA9F9